MMTVRKVLEKGKTILRENNIVNYSNEARWIFESAFECGKDFMFFYADVTVDEEKAIRYFEMINRRANGEPVQYVIGSWDFYGESFYVGDGVLIPRPETEMLVDFALDYLKDKKDAVIIDLCSGTGCIGLSVAKKLPSSKVYFVEKSDKAFSYLKKNLENFGCKNVTAIKGDIFSGFDLFDIPEPDLILSNPPYIESADIATLQSEVLLEPMMALDGGADGFDFYRVITDKWLPHCRGAIAVECGEGQAESIKEMFLAYCDKTELMSDFNDIERVVIGKISQERK